KIMKKKSSKVDSDEPDSDKIKKQKSKMALIESMKGKNEIIPPELENNESLIEKMRDYDKETKKAIIGLFFGLIAPLFMIFSFLPFEYEGVYLIDLISGLQTNFINSMFEWIYCLFKGDIINHLVEFGVLGFIITPLLPAMLTWLTISYLIGVFIKDMKKSMICIFTVFITYLISFIIFMILNDSLVTVFSPNLNNFFGGILTIVIFSFIGGILGDITGRK
ncbi:MAG: hypothetical protein GY870_14645, partial [archaeon]|nr:hypothetical protein [archaeon]